MQKLLDEAKKSANAKAQECRNSLDELEPNVRAEYDEIEEKRAQYDEAMAQGTELGFPVEEVDLRTSEELDAELNQRRADLELNNATNGNVVETYERRKKEVGFCDDFGVAIRANDVRTDRGNGTNCCAEAEEN